jgi:glycosyltransferase involved in cell wall biosynthesis
MRRREACRGNAGRRARWSCKRRGVDLNPLIGQQPEAKTILFLHPSDEAYGADRVLVETVLAAAAAGHRAAVLIADDEPPGWLSRRLAELGVPASRVPLAPARRRYFRPWRLPRYLLDLLAARRIVRRRSTELGASIIHVNTSALLVAAILGRPNGVRLVWHLHEIVERPPAVALMFRMLPLLSADRVVAVSAAVARHLRPRSRASRLRVVRNGLPDRPPNAAGRRESRSARPVVAFIGRLNHWKGYDVFVEAARQVLDAGGEADFVIAGSPPPGEEGRVAELERRLADPGASRAIRFLGLVDDVPALLDGVDVVAVPSTAPDPFPTIIVEGMRAGRAVVASNHGGANEMFEDGLSGVLVRPRDVGQLAAAIRALIADRELRARLGAAARERYLAELTAEGFRARIAAVWAEL